MGLVNFMITSGLRRRISRIEHDIQNAEEKQLSLLKRLITTAAATEYGKKHDFSSIQSLQEFKERLPVTDYEGIKHYVERMMKGEQNILWPSKISWFAKSSGTTSEKSKFIPVSREALNDSHFRGGKDLLSIYCHNNPGTKLFDGKGLIMGGSNQINSLSGRSWYGDISAVMMKNMPIVASWVRTPGLKTALMANWDEKIEAMARETMNVHVTHLVGVPTWTMVLINKIFEITGKGNLTEVWPGLELYIHGGVSFTPYREQFRKLIQNWRMHYVETYNASEGFIACQSENDDSSLLLMPNHGIYYEFMPVAEAEKPFPKTLSLDEVKTGVNYALVITTNAGLWRYVIGDTVKFTSLKPYKLIVSGRLKHYINVFGEEVIVNNTDDAIAMACHKCNCQVREYTVAPVFLTNETKGGHEWAIEFETKPKDLNQFSQVLDEALQSLNSDYEAKRFKNMALSPPIVHSLSTGTFYTWLKHKGKLGGQHKVPRLSNERTYLNELLAVEL